MLGPRQIELRGPLPQGRALDQLHGVPRNARLGAAVEDPDEPGVPQPLERVDLAPDQREHRGPGQLHGLERNEPAALEALGPVDLTHGAAAQQPAQPVRTDAADFLRHPGVSPSNPTPCALTVPKRLPPREETAICRRQRTVTDVHID
jgi:hypothetical protein